MYFLNNVWYLNSNVVIINIIKGYSFVLKKKLNYTNTLYPLAIAQITKQLSKITFLFKNVEI